MSEDRLLPSPRTAEHPMAFTRDELTRGAWYAWLIFMTTMTIGVLAIFSANFVGNALTLGSGSLSGWLFTLLAAVIGCIIIGGPVSLVAMVLGTVIALPIGRSLRRMARPALHALCYGALSTALGVVGAIIAGSLVNWLDELGIAIAVVVGLSAAVAGPFGWWLSARRALRDDAWRASAGVAAHP